MQSCRSPKAVLEYVSKDDNYVANFKVTVKRSWSQIVEESGSSEDFIQNAKRFRTHDSVMNLQRIEYFADKHFNKKDKRTYVPEYTRTDFNELPEMKDWADTYLYG